MAANIELKYFNTFWLKKIKTIANVAPGTTVAISSVSGATFTIASPLSASNMNVGQEVSMTYTDGVSGNNVNYTSTIVSRTSSTVFVVATAPVNFTGTPDITFGKIIDFDNIPQAYTSTPADDWLIEESRIRGGYNNTTVDFGVKAYLVEDEPRQSHKFSGLIHSGVFNSRTGFNATNQFSVREDITRTIDPANSSIQR